MKVVVTVVFEGEGGDDPERRTRMAQSLALLAGAYSDDEPEYRLPSDPA